MFRTPYVHRQKDCIVHAALDVHILQTGRLMAYTHGKHTIYGCMYNTVFLMMKHVDNKN